MQASRSWRRAFVASAVAAATFVLAPNAGAQFRDTIPSGAYYMGVDQLYRGDYRDAQRTFERALRGAVKTLAPTGQIRWIDSICYHAMLGETFYQWGQPAQALEQFNYACSLFLQYPRWMLRVQFDVSPTPSAARGRVAAPWGTSQRGATPAEFPETFAVAQGTLNNTQTYQQGGVVQQPQLWPVNIVEIVRCTALAIRRRNEILGPLGPFDSISKNLVLTLSRGGAPPNHWSTAWIDLQRGLAHAGVGEAEQALQYLDRSAVVAGQLDHPLTCVALLEQGRLALDAGNVDAAAQLLAEASYAAYAYEDAGVIDEAFRWWAVSFLASGAAGTDAILPVAADWARRERYDHIAARVNLAIADQLMTAGKWDAAATALAAGEQRLQDARNGLLGNRALFLEARLDEHLGRESGETKLATAVDGQMAMSLQNFQIALANSMFDAQTLPARSAATVYELLLADPSPADVVLRLLESLAVMKTPHDDAFQRWLLATLERGNLGAAMEVTDRAKRRRFHNALPWGGRLAAVRDLVAAPLGVLPAHREEQRDDLLGRFPRFAAALTDATDLRTELRKAWHVGADEDAARRVAALWKEYAAALDAREFALGEIGLAPVPADVSFPPLLSAPDLQSRLQPGQALLVYHDAPEGLLGFLFTSKASSHWDCGPSTRVGGLISQLLRDLGNFDANREMTGEQLMTDDWRKSSARLAGALFEGSALNSAGVDELIVVPDGVVWYVPFEALVVKTEKDEAPLITRSRVRYAPTVGLAFRGDGAWRRVQRTGLLLGDMVPGEKPEERLESAAPLAAAVPGPFPLTPASETPSPAIASLLDALIVLSDVDAAGPDPLAWAPLPTDRSEHAGSLQAWLRLSGEGPQRILLPGMHTLAERGGRAPRRRGAPPAGAELFFASCSLMSAGAETMLLSRWRVGGQSTLDAVREFVQELPHAAAADAWQRSVELLMESPVDPARELRVKTANAPADLTAKHPFFWAGYLVVDSGWRPPDLDGDQPATEPATEGPDAAPGGAAPPAAAPPVPAPPEERE